MKTFIDQLILKSRIRSKFKTNLIIFLNKNLVGKKVDYSVLNSKY